MNTTGRQQKVKSSCDVPHCLPVVSATGPVSIQTLGQKSVNLAASARTEITALRETSASYPKKRHDGKASGKCAWCLVLEGKCVGVPMN